MADQRTRKQEIRKEVLSRRKELPEEVRRAASHAIVEKIIRSSRFISAQTVFSFVPFGDEVDISTLIEECWKKGKAVYVPKVNKPEKRMELYRIFRWEDLEIGHYGIREPREGCPGLSGEKIDLILMPGVAFDRNKRRIGYGAGYYDRFLNGLADRPYLLAPIFQIQLIHEVPTDPWDMPVDAIVTEKEWIE
jgi:5-formyltetrahydrofolate cyclo-ligase